METIINGMRPIHPGEVLREEFLIPFGLTANALATALRLAQYFGSSAEFWLGLQTDYDMALARASMGDVLSRRVAILGCAAASAWSRHPCTYRTGRRYRPEFIKSVDPGFHG